MFNLNLFGTKEGNIDADKFDELIKLDYMIIDIRTPEEHYQSRIDGAKLMNLYDPSFKREVEKLSKEGKYVIYCRSGSRSNIALSIFKKAGIKNVFHLSGGILSWPRAGKPIVN